jgi:hypothetical protein
MNQTNRFGTFRVLATKLPAWQIALIGAAAAALLISLAVLATGVFLVVFPVIFLIDQAYRWRARRARAAAPAPRGRPVIIEAEYEVLPPERQNH